MKKVLFSLVAIGLIATTLTSCQSNQKGTEESDSTSTEVAMSTSSTETAKPKAVSNGGSEILNVSPTVKVEAPQFSNEDVNSGFAQFEPIKQAYITAIASKDAAQIKAATTKYNEWVKNAATWGSKLTKEENQIYIDHYTKLTTQWDKLSLRLKK